MYNPLVQPGPFASQYGGVRRGVLSAQPTYRDSVLQTTHDISSLSLSITTSAGAPTPQWIVTESDGQRYSYTGTSLSHTRTAAGDMTVELGPSNLSSYVTGINYHTSGWKGTFSDSDLSRVPNLVTFVAYVNSGLDYTASLRSGMTQLDIGSTASSLSLVAADIPSSMATLSIGSTSCVLTAALSDLPEALITLSVQSTFSVITGGASAVACTGIATIRVHYCALIQTQVDDIIDRIYADRASFTNAAPLLNIGGSDAAPTGTVQDPSPSAPSTPAEEAYCLVYDPLGDGFHTWDITLSSGSV